MTLKQKDALKMFKPMKQLFIMFYNEDYSETRKKPGYGGFQDIKEVVDDKNNVVKGWS